MWLGGPGTGGERDLLRVELFKARGVNAVGVVEEEPHVGEGSDGCEVAGDVGEGGDPELSEVGEPVRDQVEADVRAGGGESEVGDACHGGRFGEVDVGDLKVGQLGKSREFGPFDRIQERQF